MNLKTATLIAIIGNVLSFIGRQIMLFGNFHWSGDSLMTSGVIWLIIQLLDTGTLILFLCALYSKQK